MYVSLCQCRDACIETTLSCATYLSAEDFRSHLSLSLCTGVLQSLYVLTGNVYMSRCQCRDACIQTTLSCVICLSAKDFRLYLSLSACTDV